MSEPTPPIRVAKISYMGGACPFQCEALTEDGREIYVRYRGGRFRVYVADSPGKDPLGSNSHLVMCERIGEPLEGWMTPGDMVCLTKGVIEWPEGTAGYQAEEN